jgi:uncharacterized protein YheU (UPF0270 family)
LAQFVVVPVDQLEGDTLTRLLEEFSSRDGTDYGDTETSTEKRVQQLRRRLSSGDAQLVFDGVSEQWDILPATRVRELLGDE